MKNIILSALSNLLNFIFSKGSMVVVGAASAHIVSIKDAQTLAIIITTISAFGTLFQQAISTTHIRYNNQLVTQTKNYKLTLISIVALLSAPVSFYLYKTSLLSATNSALMFALLIAHGASGFKLATATKLRMFFKISLIGTLQGVFIISTTIPLLTHFNNTELYLIPFLAASIFWLIVSNPSTGGDDGTTTTRDTVWKTFLPTIFTGLFFLPVIWLLISDVQERFGEQEAFLLTTANQWRMTIGILPTIFGGYLLLLLVNNSTQSNTNKKNNYTITYYPALLITVACTIAIKYLHLIYPKEIVSDGKLGESIILFMLASVITTLKSSISREMIAAELAKLSIISNMIWAGTFSLLYYYIYFDTGALGVARSFLASQAIHLALWTPIIVKKDLVPKDFFDMKFFISLIPIAWIAFSYAL